MIAQILQKLNEGGPVFTYPILTIAFVVTVYFIKALRNKQSVNSISKLIASYGWFVFAWGSLGSAFGLIVAFDTLKTKTLIELTAQDLAGGFRMIMLCSLLAAFVFSLSRLFVVIINTVESRKH